MSGWDCGRSVNLRSQGTHSGMLNVERIVLSISRVKPHQAPRSGSSTTRLNSVQDQPMGQGLRIEFSIVKYAEEVAGVQSAGHSFTLGSTLEGLILSEENDCQA